MRSHRTVALAALVVSISVSAGLSRDAGGAGAPTRVEPTVIAGADEKVLVPSDAAAEVGVFPAAPVKASLPLTPDPSLVKAQQEAAEATEEYKLSARGSSVPLSQRKRAIPSSQIYAAGIGPSSGSPAPPSPTGDIAENRYLEAVSGRVNSYTDTNLSQEASLGLSSFVGAPGDDVRQPQIIRDHQHDRWYYAAERVAGPDRFFAFGWSKTNTPLPLSSGWCNFFIKTSLIDDSPRLGQDTNRIIIGSNSYDPSNGRFATAKIRTIPKPIEGDSSCDRPTATIYGSESAPLQEADGDLASQPVPANTRDDTNIGYILSSDVYNTRNQLNRWHTSGPKSAPVLTSDPAIQVPAYDIPPLVPQPNTPNGIYALDARLTEAVATPDPDDASREAIWTQHTVREPSGGLAEMRWYEIVPTDPSNPLHQIGTIGGTLAQGHIFAGSIAPTREGNRALAVYAHGDGSTNPTLAAASRNPTTPAGTFGLPTNLETSAAPLTDGVSCGPLPSGCRWGDTTAINLDTHEDGVIWGSSEISGPSGGVPQWKTRNYKLEVGGTTP